MKKCPKCGFEKELTEFRPNIKRKDGLQHYCKVCDKAFQAEWYQKNKEKCITKSKERNKKSKKKNQDYVIDYLKVHPCVDCGEDDIVVLEFDHREDKLHGISRMLRDDYSIELIQKEIDKCDVRCANCHKRKTAKQFNWYKLHRSLT